MTITLLDYIGMILASPRTIAKILIAERRSILWGFIIVISASLMLSINLSYVLIIKTLGILGLTIPFIKSVSTIAIVLGVVLGNIIAWLLLGLLLYAFDKALNGKASLENILLIYSFQWMPLFIVGLVSPIFYFLDIVSSILLLTLVTIIALLWGYIIVLIANAEANGFSLARSFVASILQLLIVFSVIVYIPILIGVMI